MLSVFLLLKKIFKYLNSNENIQDIALSLTVAFLMGIMPFNLMFFMPLFLLLILMNGNLLLFLCFYPIFGLFDDLFYYLFHIIGDYLLSLNSLQAFFEFIYNIPVLIYLNWNYTIQLGSYILFFILIYPLFIVFKRLIYIYRTYLYSKIVNSKFYKLFKIPKWITILFMDQSK